VPGAVPAAGRAGRRQQGRACTASRAAAAPAGRVIDGSRRGISSGSCSGSRRGAEPVPASRTTTGGRTGGSWTAAAAAGATFPETAGRKGSSGSRVK